MAGKLGILALLAALGGAGAGCVVFPVDLYDYEEFTVTEPATGERIGADRVKSDDEAGSDAAGTEVGRRAAAPPRPPVVYLPRPRMTFYVGARPYYHERTYRHGGHYYPYPVRRHYAYHSYGHHAYGRHRAYYHRRHGVGFGSRRHH